MEDRGQLDAGGARDELRHVSLGFGHPRRIAPVGHPLQQSGQRRDPWLSGGFCLGHAAAGPQRGPMHQILAPTPSWLGWVVDSSRPQTGLMFAPVPWNEPKTPSTLLWKATDGSASKAPGSTEYTRMAGCWWMRKDAWSTRPAANLLDDGGSIITMDRTPPQSFKPTAPSWKMKFRSPNSGWMCCRPMVCKDRRRLGAAGSRPGFGRHQSHPPRHARRFQREPHPSDDRPHRNQRAAQANLELLRMHDTTLDLAWNTLADRLIFGV